MNVRYTLATLAAALGVAAAWADRSPVAVVAATPVAALDLAEWIRDGKEGLRIVDLRSENAFDEEHVPGAQPMDLASLRAAPFDPTDTVVLCASDRHEVERAAAELRETGHRNVLSLRGGLAAWRDEVMFPAVPDGASPSEQAAYARAAGLSRYFGGSPRKGAPKTGPAPSRPRGC
jgi:rhodanese-related sulfurtransferase